MINIQKHIISEAFEQLSNSSKLKESIKSDLFRIFNSKGFDTSKESVKNYIDAAEEYIEMWQEHDPEYSAEEWYSDTLRNAPEELKELKDDEDEDYTEVADWEDTTEVKFDESVKYPNGELVTDIDLDTYLDYYYGEDRDKDNNNYSVREKQRATDYWFKKNDTPVNESKLTEAPLTPAEYAAKARARKSQNPLQKINSQLNPDMTIIDQLQVYFDELVPSSGKATTVAGEIVRALMRLLYRGYNDGDLWYSGYGKETCGSEVIYLINELPDFAYDYFSRMAENAMEDAEYTDMLEELAEQAIVYLNENPQLFTQENIDDSRRHDYRKLDDIFSMPTFDYEPDTSFDPSYYQVGDDDIDELLKDFIRSELGSGSLTRWARDGWTIVDLDKEDYERAIETWPDWFESFLEDHEREEEDQYDDEEDFDESLNKDNQKRGKYMNIVAEDFQISNLDKMGTNEYEANTNRDKHIRMYRKFANISDSEPITEETINQYALDKTATYCNREPERIKAEILGQRYSEYEQE